MIWGLRYYLISQDKWITKLDKTWGNAARITNLHKLSNIWDTISFFWVSISLIRQPRGPVDQFAQALKLEVTALCWWQLRSSQDSLYHLGKPGPSGQHRWPGLNFGIKMMGYIYSTHVDMGSILLIQTHHFRTRFERS